MAGFFIILLFLENKTEIPKSGTFNGLVLSSSFCLCLFQSLYAPTLKSGTFNGLISSFSSCLYLFQSLYAAIVEINCTQTNWQTEKWNEYCNLLAYACWVL